MSDIIDRAEAMSGRGYWMGPTMWEDLLEECKRQQERAQKAEAAAVDSRAQYLLWLDLNPECAAWNFDELEPAEQEKYRQQAAESLEMEEPWAIIQLREAGAEAARWQAAAVRERAIIIHIGYGDIEVAPSGDELEIAEADLGCSPRAWLMTEERIRALEWMVAGGNTCAAREVLRTMLAEAKQ